MIGVHGGLFFLGNGNIVGFMKAAFGLIIARRMAFGFGYFIH